MGDSDDGQFDLEYFARVQIAYEVRTLFGQVVELLLRDREPWDPVYLALVEAPLVHLRALDDFLGMRAKKARKDDVVAEHYLPGGISWKPTTFLDDDTRGAINAQLQHLAGRRETGYSWDFPMMCIAFIDGFLDFTEALGASDQGGGVNRAKWFTEPIDLCRIVRGLSQIDDGPFDEHGS